MCLGVSYFMSPNLYFILPSNFEVLFVVLLSSRIWFVFVANVTFSIMSEGNNSIPFVFYSKSLSLFFPSSSLTFLFAIHLIIATHAPYNNHSYARVLHSHCTGHDKNKIREMSTPYFHYGCYIEKSMKKDLYQEMDEKLFISHKM